MLLVCFSPIVLIRIIMVIWITTMKERIQVGEVFHSARYSATEICKRPVHTQHSMQQDFKPVHWNPGQELFSYNKNLDVNKGDSVIWGISCNMVTNMVNISIPMHGDLPVHPLVSQQVLHNSMFRRSWSPEDEPYTDFGDLVPFISGDTMWLTFLVYVERSSQLLFL